jgi:5,10-methylenetetrahydrofolate reductase
MSLLERALSEGEFVVTTELTPPKGIDLTELYANADSLKEYVHAINLTDSHRARMTVEPKAVAHLLLSRGVEPIVQITARDRNRIAIQADLLGASALGIENFVFMTGDSPEGGDHPSAKAVFDLTTTEMLAAADGLSAGRDMQGNALKGAPKLFIGAVANPVAKSFEAEIANTQRKVDSGAKFLQTQAIFEPARLETFMLSLQRNVSVLAGVIPLKSAKMARWLAANVPGIIVPEAVLAELDAAAGSRREEDVGIAIAGRLIGALRPVCAGVHIMAIGWERQIPQILAAGGIRR